MRALSDATAEMLKPVKLQSTDRIKIEAVDELKKFKVQITGVYPSGLTALPSNQARSAWLHRVPERKDITANEVGPAGHSTWLLAATDYTAEILRAVWMEEHADKVEWADENARTLYDYLLLTTTRQDINAEHYAAFKIGGIVPTGLSDAAIHPELPLAGFQRAAATISQGSEGYGLFMEQGTGKTATVIARICAEAAECKHMYRAIIVCPKALRLNWRREIERFTTLPCKITIMKGGKYDRIHELITAMTEEDDCKFSVVIVSYEGMTISEEAITAFQWDLALLDESHFIKWPRTKRCIASMKLRNAARQRMVLTGTPICNTPLDLYAQLEFLGEGWSGFKSWENFREFYGVFNKSEGESHRKLVSIQNKPFMKERLARLSFIITKKEAMPYLPDKVYDVYEVEMTPRQTEVYAQIAKDMLAEIENEMDEGGNDAMTVQNILVKLLRLAQICSGYAVWDGPLDVENDTMGARRLEWFDKNPKLEALVEMLKEKGPNEKTLVWCCFVPDIKVISERLTKEGIKHVCYFGGTKDADRDANVTAFNADPSVKVLIGNPAAGGVGLNLVGYPYWDGENSPCETNCDHEVFYSQDWSMSKRAQAEDRPHRRGTRTNIRVTDLVVPETIDEDIRLRVLNKKKTALEISDVREILINVLKSLGHAVEQEEEVEV